MRIVVFAGPSIEPEACARFPVELRAPVRRGDIDALVAEETPPDRIGIVDGQFLQGLMLSPKEVLRAMDDHGVQVYGSSSLGALRAAELAGHGMKGVGQVFELYHSGRVDADDEVAITFDPDSLRALCEPMVNIRIAMAAAAQSGAVTAELADAALDIAKTLYFPDRTYARVLHELAAQAGEAELRDLRAFLENGAPNAKRADAITLLEEISA
ncbi:TfuA-like protein [Nonomuraea sp. NPDC046570]|uniref:TfuA-like protein n=1 Tax=Nonomuraea sp. NPDC046570 TaxID=3155255 RepID=UPI0033F6C7BF